MADKSSIKITIPVEFKAQTSSMNNIISKLEEAAKNIDLTSGLGKKFSQYLKNMKQSVAQHSAIAMQPSIDTAGLNTAKKAYSDFQKYITQLGAELDYADIFDFNLNKSELASLEAFSNKIKDLNKEQALLRRSGSKRSAESYLTQIGETSLLNRARAVSTRFKSSDTFQANKKAISAEIGDAKDRQVRLQAQQVDLQSEGAKLAQTLKNITSQLAASEAAMKRSEVIKQRGDFLSKFEGLNEKVLRTEGGQNRGQTGVLSAFMKPFEAGAVGDRIAESNRLGAESVLKYLGFDAATITSLLQQQIPQIRAAIAQQLNILDGSTEQLGNESYTKIESVRANAHRYMRQHATSARYEQLETERAQVNALRAQQAAANKDVAANIAEQQANSELLQETTTLVANLNSVSAALERFANQLDNLEQSELSEQIASQHEQQRAYTKELREKYGTPVRKARDSEQLSSDLYSDTGANLKTTEIDVEEAEQFSNNLKQSLKHWMGAYEIVNLVKQGLRQAVDDIKGLDASMANIAVVTDMSVSDLWGKVGDYMSIAQQYGVSTQGVYEVSQLYYQQGLATNEVMAATTETLKLARIAGMGYAEAADAMTVAIRSFKMEMQDAGHVTDVYSKVAAITASDSEELAIAMSKTASSAESVGSSFENTTAMLAVMVETTRESAQNLGSALKSIISRYGEMKSGLTQDSEGEIIDYNKTDAALRSIGISIKDAQGQFRDFDDVIFELSEKWDSLDKNTQRYIATIMAGNRQQSRFIALVDNWERLDEVATAAENSEDAGLLQYAKTIDTLETKLTNLSTIFQSFYMDALNGESIKGLLDIITNVVEQFARLNPLTSAFNLIKFVGQIKQVGQILLSAFQKPVNEVRKAVASYGNAWENGPWSKVGSTIANKINQALKTEVPQAVEEAAKQAEQVVEASQQTSSMAAKSEADQLNKQYLSSINEQGLFGNKVFRGNQHDKTVMAMQQYQNRAQQILNNPQAHSQEDLKWAQAVSKTCTDWTNAVKSATSQEQATANQIALETLAAADMEAAKEKQSADEAGKVLEQGAQKAGNKLATFTEKVKTGGKKALDFIAKPGGVGRQWSAAGASIGGMALSSMAMAQDTSTMSGYARANNMSLAGGVLSAVGSAAMGGPMGWITAIITLISSLSQFIETWQKRDEVALENAKKAEQETKSEAAQKRAEASDLESTIKNLKKLQAARYDSEEAAQAFTEAANAAAEKFPQLVSSYDSVGNAIIDVTNNMAAAELALMESRTQAAQATYEAAQAEAYRIYLENKQRDKQTEEIDYELNTDLEYSGYELYKIIDSNASDEGWEEKYTPQMRKNLGFISSIIQNQDKDGQGLHNLISSYSGEELLEEAKAKVEEILKALGLTSIDELANYDIYGLANLAYDAYENNDLLNGVNFNALGSSVFGGQYQPDLGFFGTLGKYNQLKREEQQSVLLEQNARKHVASSWATYQIRMGREFSTGEDIFDAFDVEGLATQKALSGLNLESDFAVGEDGTISLTSDAQNRISQQIIQLKASLQGMYDELKDNGYLDDYQELTEQLEQGIITRAEFIDKVGTLINNTGGEYNDILDLLTASTQAQENSLKYLTFSKIGKTKGIEKLRYLQSYESYLLKQDKTDSLEAQQEYQEYLNKQISKIINEYAESKPELAALLNSITAASIQEMTMFLDYYSRESDIISKEGFVGEIAKKRLDVMTDAFIKATNKFQVEPEKLSKVLAAITADDVGSIDWYNRIINDEELTGLLGEIGIDTDNLLNLVYTDINTRIHTGLEALKTRNEKLKELYSKNADGGLDFDEAWKFYELADGTESGREFKEFFEFKDGKYTIIDPSALSELIYQRATSEVQTTLKGLKAIEAIVFEAAEIEEETGTLNAKEASDAADKMLRQALGGTEKALATFKNEHNEIYSALVTEILNGTIRSQEQLNEFLNRYRTFAEQGLEYYSYDFNSLITEGAADSWLKKNTSKTGYDFTGEEGAKTLLKIIGKQSAATTQDGIEKDINEVVTRLQEERAIFITESGELIIQDANLVVALLDKLSSEGLTSADKNAIYAAANDVKEKSKALSDSVGELYSSVIEDGEISPNLINDIIDNLRAQGVDEGVILELYQQYEQVEEGTLTQLFNFIRNITTSMQNAGIEIDHEAINIAMQSALDTLVDSLSARLKEGVSGTLNDADYLDLQSRYSVKGMKTASGWTLNEESVKILLTSITDSLYAYGGELGLGSRLLEIGRDAGVEIFDSYSNLNKAAEEAATNAQKMSDASEEGAQAAWDYANALMAAADAAKLSADSYEFNFMTEDATDGLTKNFDNYVATIDSVKNVLKALSSGGEVGYQEFYNFMDFIKNYGGEGFEQLRARAEAAGMSWEDFVNKVVTEHSKLGKVDIGGVAAELGISVQEATNLMTQSMSEGLEQVARDQIEYLSGLEKMLEAMATLNGLEAEMGITVQTKINGKDTELADFDWEEVIANPDDYTLTGNAGAIYKFFSGDDGLFDEKEAQIANQITDFWNRLTVDGRTQFKEKIGQLTQEQAMYLAQALHGDLGEIDIDQILRDVLEGNVGESYFSQLSSFFGTELQGKKITLNGQDVTLTTDLSKSITIEGLEGWSDEIENQLNEQLKSAGLAVGDHVLQEDGTYKISVKPIIGQVEKTQEDVIADGIRQALTGELDIDTSAYNTKMDDAIEKANTLLKTLEGISEFKIFDKGADTGTTVEAGGTEQIVLDDSEVVDFQGPSAREIINSYRKKRTDQNTDGIYPITVAGTGTEGTEDTGETETEDPTGDVEWTIPEDLKVVDFQGVDFQGMSVTEIINSYYKKRTSQNTDGTQTTTVTNPGAKDTKDTGADTDTGTVTEAGTTDTETNSDTKEESKEKEISKPGTEAGADTTTVTRTETDDTQDSSEAESAATILAGGGEEATSKIKDILLPKMSEYSDSADAIKEIISSNSQLPTDYNDVLKLAFEDSGFLDAVRTDMLLKQGVGGKLPEDFEFKDIESIFKGWVKEYKPDPAATGTAAGTESSANSTEVYAETAVVEATEAETSDLWSDVTSAREGKSELGFDSTGDLLDNLRKTYGSDLDPSTFVSTVVNPALAKAGLNFEDLIDLDSASFADKITKAVQEFVPPENTDIPIPLEANDDNLQTDTNSAVGAITSPPIRVPLVVEGPSFPPRSPTEGGGGGGGFYEIAQQWTGNMNNLTGSAFAEGNVVDKLLAGANLANKTLVGELGPELAVYNGKYHILGVNGAELVNLPSNAIVFNHLQTEGIFKGQMNIRGQSLAQGNALATGNVSGPAMASGGGIDAALQAVRRAKSVWQSLLNDLSAAELLQAGGGGGGGGGSAVIEDLQEWYNLSRQIVKIESEINQLLAERENIYAGDGAAYLRSLREEQSLLTKQIAKEKELLGYQKEQLAAQAEEINTNPIWSQFLEVGEDGLLQYKEGNETNGGKGALEVLAELNKMSAAEQEKYLKNLGYSATDSEGKQLTGSDLVSKFFEDIQKQIDDYDTLYDTVNETEASLAELQTSFDEINDEIKQNQKDLEQEIYDVIVDAWEAEIEALEEQKELIEKANEAYVQGIRDAYDTEKKMYEDSQNIADREALQRQLSLLRRSGGSASEIADLEEQLNDTLKDEYFANQEEMISNIEEANEKQIELLEKQITLENDALEYQKENGVIWQQVADIMSGSHEEIMDFLSGNDPEFHTQSRLAQEEALENWSKKVGIYTEDREYQNIKNDAEKALWDTGDIWKEDGMGELKDSYSELSDDAKSTAREAYLNAYALAKQEGKDDKEAHAAGLDAFDDYVKPKDTDDDDKDDDDTSSKKKGMRYVSGSIQAQIGVKARSDGTKEPYYYTFSAGIRTDSANEDEIRNAIRPYLYAKVSQLTNEEWKKAAKDKIAGKFKLQGFSKGGLVDYTGPAVVHGTPSKPEAFLNANQTAMIADAVKFAGDGGALDGIKSTISALQNAIKGIADIATNTSSNITIAPGAVSIQVEQLNDSYDVEELSNDIFNRMVSIASKATGRSVNRR